MRSKYVYSASDYAGLHGCGRFSFYFGYEETIGEGDDEEWCFVAKENGKEVLRIPESRLGWSGGQSTKLGVLEGIAMFLEQNFK